MLLPNDVRSKFARVVAAAGPLGERRVEELVREITLTVASQVISQMEMQVAAELSAARRDKQEAKSRIVSAGFVLPELHV